MSSNMIAEELPNQYRMVGEDDLNTTSSTDGERLDEDT